MELTKKLDICLGHLHDLIISFEEAKETKTLSEDFFSDNLEHLEQIKEVMNSMERPQEPVEEPKETAATPAFLEDKISKTLFADFKKALSLNDRFRFQRDLFKGDAGLMDEALDRINAFKTYDEARDYLKEQYDWDWQSESAQAFDELLRKRFS